MEANEYTPTFEAARRLLEPYDLSDREIKAVVTAVLAAVRSRVQSLPIKSDYDGEAWLDLDAVVAILNDDPITVEDG